MTTPLWEGRFRAPSLGFPIAAKDAAHRCIHMSTESGTREIYCWDRHTDERLRATDRPNGTSAAAITPDGEQIWWFADTDGDEFGRWMRQPFGTATEADATAAVPGLAPGWPQGLILGRDTAVLGLSRRDGVTIYSYAYDGAPTDIYTTSDDAKVSALSEDETFIAIEYGDFATPSIHVSRTDGTAIDTLSDLPERGLRVAGFSPIAGDQRLLVQHERHDRQGLLLWSPGAGGPDELEINLPGDLAARWYPGGEALLVRCRHRGRSQLYRYELATGRLTLLRTPHGSVFEFDVRPDSRVEYIWCSDESPHAILAEGGDQVLTVGSPALESVPLSDHWVDGPAGPIHTLVSDGQYTMPPATIFWMTGGPGGWIDHEFMPLRAAFIDAGYRVIHANYRGSDGYGPQWRDANRVAPGLIELEDLAAVRDWAVDQRLADPNRCVVSGVSWGGYLTLLALGTQPERWAAGIGLVPIGDLIALYEDEMEPVRQADRAFFGGTPGELPDKWAASNPITYVDQVQAPLFVTGGVNDARCPIRQIENFLARLKERGAAYEVHRFNAGHGIADVNEEIQQARLQLDFLARHVPNTP